MEIGVKVGVTEKLYKVGNIVRFLRVYCNKGVFINFRVE